MKRPFALIGFTTFSLLLFLKLTEKAYPAFVIMVISVVTGIVSLIIKRYRQATAIPVFMFTVAFACLLFLTSDTDKALAQSFSDNRVKIEATVSEAPDFNKSRGRYYSILKLEKINGQKTKGRLRLSFSYEKDGINPSELQPGNRLNFEATLYTPGENEKEVSRYFTGEKIYLGAYSAKNMSITEPKYRSLSFYFTHIRKFVSDKLQYGFSDRDAGLLTAILTGDKTYLDDTLYKSFRKSGAAHLMAVSGMHLSIWVLALGALIPENKRTSKFKYLLLIFIVLFIMLLAGMSESVKRAGFMLIVFLSGKLSDRRSDSLNSLGFSVLLMTVINPSCVLSTSLQLSFLATLSILTLGKAMMKNWRELTFIKKRKLLRNNPFALCFDSIIISISILIFTFPILIYGFGGISTVTVLSNLLLLPVTTPLLFLTGIYVLFSGISFVAFPLSFIIRIFSSYTAFVAERCAEIPKAFLPFEKEEFILYLTAVILIIWFTVSILKKDIIRRTAFNLTVLTLCALLITVYESKPPENIRLHFFNINEKLITAIEKDSQAILLVGKSDYEEELAISSLEEKGITVCTLAERKGNLVYLTDAESGKISYEGESITLFDLLKLNIQDNETTIEAYGNNISIFHRQPLQYGDTYDIITVSQTETKDRLILSTEGNQFHSDEKEGFVLTLNENNTITLRGENSWQNLTKKS